MAYEYQEYPKFLYHPTLAAEGKVFQSANETAGLAEQGWVDSPAKFPLALFTDALARLSPLDLQQFVTDVVRASGEFDRVGSEVPVAGFRVDILATRNTGTPGEAEVAFEVKKVAIAAPELVRSVHRQESSIKSIRPDLRFVLVVSGRLSEAAQDAASQLKLSYWDAGDLFRQTNDSLAAKWFLGLAALAGSGAEPRRIDALEQTLSTIKSGDTEALRYQKWVADTFEHLFVPPLGPVHYEDSDEVKRNRRDLILENWAQDGFWSQLRAAYRADQVVVDAKNFSTPIKKGSVIELSHYLKPHGCGMFGIIATRLPPSPSARHALREEWIGSRKMILILDDALMREMLRLKALGTRGEEVLRDQIGRFRKSL